ncbi:MAG: GAF domain-containing protein [Clostridia bacterium]|nr:GAF domain-containing protein [Clostridia bacterium]MBQ6325546.1 GAF domain-containing protein [Clostridia bacterium]MBQ8962955.1 GAF domain-containing protein [Clostridia bacterium]MBQ9040230.1 GAF domain-containing protein [Clostridia bacterium]
MDYELLGAQLQSFAEADNWYVPLMANAAALLFDALADVNWVGFYLLRGDRLVLGPFQGKVACIHIPLGKGVCGTAAQRDETQLVPDVHAFPGHIACDSASNSEIVVPIHRKGALKELNRRAVVAVLDIDSPVPNRFSEADRAGLEALVKVLEAHIDLDA